MTSRQEIEFPGTMYQLAEQHRVGQPLALYNLQPRWKRYLNLIDHFLLIVVFCAVLFLLVATSIFFYRVIELQIADVQFELPLFLQSILVCFVMGAHSVYVRYLYKYRAPRSALICTEGLLVISPKEVKVVYWTEVRGLLKVPGSGRRKRYILYRIHHKSLKLNDIYEDFDGLINLVRQHIPQQL